MTKKTLIKRIKRDGCILAKNFGPIESILKMDEFVAQRREEYTFFGYIFNAPVFMKKPKINK